MFGKKNRTIEPAKAEENVLIQITPPTPITKKTKVSVPSHYRAIAYVDQKPVFRIDPCMSKEFVKTYGKEYIGKQLSVAFIMVHSFAQSQWGFGNIPVNNTRLKEAYRIGANGKFGIEVVDYAKAIGAFPNHNQITIEQIREKAISTLKTVGTPIMSEYFSKTTTSVFEMNSLIADFRTKFVDALKDEKLFIDMGVKVDALTVDSFHVNEEDLDLIRSRING